MHNFTHSCEKKLYVIDYKAFITINKYSIIYKLFIINYLCELWGFRNVRPRDPVVRLPFPV